VRVLVTGSEGFIGSRFQGLEMQRVDSELGWDVLDDLTTGYIRDFDPQVVFHLAAKHYIPWCNAHPAETFRINVIGTARVLGACGPSLHTVALASSAAVYGFDDEPIFESHPLLGKGAYAVSKIAAERSLAAFSETRPHVRCVAARLFNVVGTGDSHDHILPRLFRGETMVGNTWPRRDYVHVDDVHDALWFLSNNAPLGFSAYNVGTGRGTSVAELASLAGIDITEGEGRADDGHLVSDPSALKTLGWEPARTLEDAIGDLKDGADAVALGA